MLLRGGMCVKDAARERRALELWAAALSYREDARPSHVVVSRDPPLLRCGLKLCGGPLPPGRPATQITQLKFRLAEGDGECFYYIGERTPCQPRPVRTTSHCLNGLLRAGAVKAGRPRLHPCGVP